MPTNQEQFVQYLDSTRAGLRMLVIVAAVLVVLSAVMACDGDSRPYDPGIDIKISGRVVSSTSGAPLPATVILFDAPTLFDNYQNVGGGATNSVGEFEFTTRVYWCMAPILKARSPGYRDTTVEFTGHDVECTSRPQVFNLSLSPVPETR